MFYLVAGWLVGFLFMETTDHYPHSLNDGKHIFVFGSNLAGRHGKGAALAAKIHWSAETGIGMGRTGQAYAIPTKTIKLQVIPLWKIQLYVEDFLHYAESEPTLIFLVTKIGCGLAGYKETEIAPMFRVVPENCVRPIGWRDLGSA